MTGSLRRKSDCVPGQTEAAGAPQWQTGIPPEGVLLLGHSNHPSRAHKPPELYIWTGTNFQCLIGWYDHAITHWIATSHRTDERPAEPDPFMPKEASGNRQRLAEKAAKRANATPILKARTAAETGAVGTDVSAASGSENHDR